LGIFETRKRGADLSGKKWKKEKRKTGLLIWAGTEKKKGRPRKVGEWTSGEVAKGKGKGKDPHVPEVLSRRKGGEKEEGPQREEALGCKKEKNEEERKFHR